MNEIELGNLRGEVVVLRHLVRMLVGEMEFHPNTSAKIRSALELARLESADKSPDRISIDAAINRLAAHTWLQR